MVDTNNSGLRHLVSRCRYQFVTLVIILCLGGSVVDLAFDVEHWPLSNYPMYSWLTPDTQDTFVLYGVTGSPGPEIPLDSEVYIYPFDPGRLSGSFEELVARSQSDDGSL